MKSISELPSPCYVLEEDKLRRNLAVVERVRKEVGVEIVIALKGFAMWSAFPMIRNRVEGAAASSLNEVQLADEHLDARAYTYCVAYDDVEFDEIVNKSSHLTFNSLDQYNRFASRVPESVSIGLRVNPEWSDVTTDLYNPASSSSRLGIQSSDLPVLPKNVEGLHFHVLCESDSKSLENVIYHFLAKFGHLIKDLKWVNMGGGHLMTSEGYDVDHLITVLRGFKDEHDVDIILEPGSAFVWETGNLHTRVLDVVKNGGVATAIIDASFTCHMPDCLEMPYRPSIVGASESKNRGSRPYRLGGISCLAGDFLDEYWFEKDLRVGDEIVFEDMIHYTMVKTTIFNGIKHPSIAIKYASGNIEVVREFGYSDYRDRLS